MEFQEEELEYPCAPFPFKRRSRSSLKTGTRWTAIYKGVYYDVERMDKTNKLKFYRDGIEVNKGIVHLKIMSDHNLTEVRSNVAK